MTLYLLKKRWCVVKWSTDYEPDPRDLFIDVDSFHILAVGVTGDGQACRMAVIGSYNSARKSKVSREQIFGGEFKVCRRIKDVAQGKCFSYMPVPGIVNFADQQSACFDALAFVDIE